MLVYKNEMRIGPKDDRSHRKIPFTLHRPYKGLQIAFSYTPKQTAVEIAGIGETAADNLITVSLACEDDYIGAYHNPNPEQVLRIAGDASSPGFIRYPVRAGAWELQLAMHAVLSEVLIELAVEVFG